jgi:hypothetical protein
MMKLGCFLGAEIRFGPIFKMGNRSAGPIHRRFWQQFRENRPFDEPVVFSNGPVVKSIIRLFEFSKIV